MQDDKAVIYKDYKEVDRAYEQRRLRRRLLRDALCVVVVGGGVIGTLLLWFATREKALDRWVLQLFYAIRGEVVSPSNIIIVGWSDAMRARYGDPLPRAVLAEGLQKIAEAKPMLLIYDSSIPKDSRDPEGDKKMARAFSMVPTVIGAGQFFSPAGTGEYVTGGSDPIFSAAAKFEIPMVFRERFGYVGLIGRDLRPAATLYERVPLAKAVPAEIIDPAMKPPTFNALINFYGPPGTIKSVTFLDVLDGDAEFAKARFANQLVFVGEHSIEPTADGIIRSDEFDIYAYWRRMYGVEIHATIIGNLSDQSWLRRIDSRYTALLVAAAASLIFACVFSPAPVITYCILFVALGILTSINYLLFAWHQIWIEGIGVLWIAGVVSLAVVSIYREVYLERINAYLDEIEPGSVIE